MKEIDIVKFLKFFLKKIEDKDLMYRISGSLALKIQGMELIPKDIDIICDNFTFLELKYLFKNYIVKEGRKEDLKGDYFLLDIKGIEVDILCFDDEKTPMLYKIYTVSWHKLELPVLPLYETQKFYELTNRYDKAQRVKQYLKEI